MRDPITNKSQMYSLLSAGLLGNTINQYFSVAEWKDSDEYHRIPMWGVRTLTPGGPCRLYCPRDEVEATVQSFQPHEVNISCMIDAICRVNLMADIFMGDYGLEVYGMLYPPPQANWRRDMPSLGKTYRHMHARGVLSATLTPADIEDVSELLELYPDHVIELSACDRYLGRFPRRKGIIWEVRCTGGVYEEQLWRQSRTVPQRQWSRDGD